MDVFTNSEILNKKLNFMTRAEYENKASVFLDLLKTLDDEKAKLLKAQQAYMKSIAAFVEAEALESQDAWDDNGNTDIDEKHPFNVISHIVKFASYSVDFDESEQYANNAPHPSELLHQILGGSPFKSSAFWLDRLLSWDIATHYITKKGKFESLNKIKVEGFSKYVIGEFVAALLNIAFEMGDLNQIILFNAHIDGVVPNKLETPWFKLNYSIDYLYEESDDEVVFIDLELTDSKYMDYLNKMVANFSVGMPDKLDTYL